MWDEDFVAATASIRDAIIDILKQQTLWQQKKVKQIISSKISIWVQSNGSAIQTHLMCNSSESKISILCSLFTGELTISVYNTWEKLGTHYTDICYTVYMYLWFASRLALPWSLIHALVVYERERHLALKHRFERCLLCRILCRNKESFPADVVMGTLRQNCVNLLNLMKMCAHILRIKGPTL